MTVRIRVRGHLDHAWSEWLQGLTIAHDPNGETLLYGVLSDDAALYAVLLKLADLALPLVCLKSATTGKTTPGRTDEGQPQEEQRLGSEQA